MYEPLIYNTIVVAQDYSLIEVDTRYTFDNYYESAFFLVNDEQERLECLGCMYHKPWDKMQDQREDHAYAKQYARENTAHMIQWNLS